MEHQFEFEQEDTPSAGARAGALTASPGASETVSAEQGPYLFGVDAALSALLHKEAAVQRAECIASLTWGGAVVAVTLELFREAYPLLPVGPLFGALSVLGTIGIVHCVGMSARGSKRRQDLTEALSHAHGTTYIASLIRTLQVPTHSIRNLAKERLIALLPTLRASDADALGEAERKLLRNQLLIYPNDTGYRDLREIFSRAAYRREMDLRLAILRAFEQVGGAEELAAVERVARGLPTLYSAAIAPEELRTAARACLPYLRTTAEKSGSELLRASGRPEDAGPDLLRAVHGAPPSPPDQLLRGSDPPGL